MGTGKKKAAAKYVHNHNHNPKARESEERRIQKLHQLSAKRLQNLVDKQKQILSSYLPEGKLRVATKIAPEYQLKGAARVARETYQDPNFREADIPENILKSMSGQIYQHEEGAKLLQYMMDKGVYQHNKMQHTKDAIATFEEILTLDTSDPMNARHSLLRCHLDNADAELARGVIEKYQSIDSNSVVFLYTMVFIEIVSLQLEEDGASKQLIDTCIQTAHNSNPYLIWLLAYPELFSEMEDVVDDLIGTHVFFENDSLQEALRYCRLDLDLWTEDPSTAAHLLRYIKEHKLVPIDVQMEEEPESESNANQGQPTSSNKGSSGDINNVKSGGEHQVTQEDTDVDADSDAVSEIVEQCKAMYNLALSLIRRQPKR